MGAGKARRWWHRICYVGTEKGPTKCVLAAGLCPTNSLHMRLLAGQRQALYKGVFGDRVVLGERGLNE